MDKKDLDVITNGDEKALRELKGSNPHSLEELQQIINALEKREHDYGTCVYAISLASFATFNYMAYKLGITGFQASAANLDFIKRSRRYKNGFEFLDYSKLLYPQHEADFPSWEKLLIKNRKQLSKQAKKCLKESEYAHEDVKNHWKSLILNEEVL